MLRPDVTIAGAYLDEWGMLFAAVVTAWSGVDYLLKLLRLAALRSREPASSSRAAAG